MAILKADFLDNNNLIEEAQKINSISMNPSRTTTGPASWTNPRTSASYNVANGGEQALAKKIRDDNAQVFGVLDMVPVINNKLDRLAGTTAQRPTEPAVGTMYFDTTLGKPIWYNGSGWVDAEGGAT